MENRLVERFILTCRSYRSYVPYPPEAPHPLRGRLPSPANRL